MIVRPNQNLIDIFYSKADIYIATVVTLAGVSLSVEKNWIISPDNPADDTTIHDLFFSLPVISQIGRPAGSPKILSVMSAANDIAKITYRGPGNYLICSAKTLASLGDTKYLAMTTTIFQDNNIPDDEAFVFYQGGMQAAVVDGPFAFDGNTKLKLHPDWQNYIRRIQFV